MKYSNPLEGGVWSETGNIIQKLGPESNCQQLLLFPSFPSCALLIFLPFPLSSLFFCLFVASTQLYKDRHVRPSVRQLGGQRPDVKKLISCILELLFLTFLLLFPFLSFRKLCDEDWPNGESRLKYPIIPCFPIYFIEAQAT